MNSLLIRPEFTTLAKGQIIQMLDAVCQSIEPTETQYNDARSRYETIGAFLAEEASPLHPFRPRVYPQGSMRTRTVTRPVFGKEFDVDLVCEFTIAPHTDPKVVKRLVWDRFRTSERYRAITVEKNRCVQINYAGDFHMDVMPCIPGGTGWTTQGSVWVPDKKLDAWKPSNPTEFAQFVETAAAKRPRQSFIIANSKEAKLGHVTPLPADQSFTKPPLLRIIQLLKRSRDEYFRADHDTAPISVVITTLATHSYSRAVDHSIFDSVYDLLLEVVATMTEFIRVSPHTAHYSIPNPSLPEENFAERWNANPDLPNRFFIWHKRVSAELKALAQQEAVGLDKVGKLLEGSFGNTAANQAIRAMSGSVRDGVAVGKTGVTAAGLVVPVFSGIGASAPIPRHAFHGF